MKTNKVISSYEEAVKYLGNEQNEICHLELSLSHVKALIALNKLFTIAEAWNEVDCFKPDFSDEYQERWAPLFEYSHSEDKLICSNVCEAGSRSCAFGTKLCFKTRERAMQFGEQFIDLWNQALDGNFI